MTTAKERTIGKMEEYQTKIIHLSNFNTLLNSECGII